jgi:PleD family two-component response regulator
MGTLPKIIILEDDATIRRLYRAEFLHEGFAVRAFGDAVAIVDKVTSFQPDIVLTDLLMPSIDGYSVIRSLRGSPATKAVPIVVISNLGDSASQERSAALGANDFIIKSNYTPAALSGRIREFLNRPISRRRGSPHRSKKII